MRIRIQEMSLNADPDYCENSKCDSATRTNACAHLCLLAPSLICLGAHDRPIFRVYCICRSCSVLMTRKRWAMWRWTLKWIMPHIQYTSIPVSLNPRWRPTNLVGGERGPSLINQGGAHRAHRTHNNRGAAIKLIFLWVTVSIKTRFN